MTEVFVHLHRFITHSSHLLMLLNAALQIYIFTPVENLPSELYLGFSPPDHHVASHMFYIAQINTSLPVFILK